MTNKTISYPGVRPKGNRFIWQANVRIDGVRHTPSGSADTALEAFIAKEQAVAALKTGRPPRDRRHLSVGAYLAEWAAHRTEIEDTTAATNHHYLRYIQPQVVVGRCLIAGIAELPLGGDRGLRAAHVRRLYAEVPRV